MSRGSAVNQGAPPLTNLRQGETVLLYPTIGHRTEDGDAWKILVRGVVYEPGPPSTFRKKLMIRMLQRVMHASNADLDNDLFRERVSCFIADTERGRRIVMQVGGNASPLRKKTRRNGQFDGYVRLSCEELQHLREQGQFDNSWLHFQALGPPNAPAPFAGKAQMLEDEGVSVISDIDDTIKDSEVADRRTLLANTFLREYRAVEGMPELYSHWAQQGAAFHYVSSSPWQLLGPLEQWRCRAGFPQGSYHLRLLRLRDHMLRRMLLLRRPGKGAAIESLLKMFPNRRFVLVGDSGERDPKLYADIARRHPQQILRILIRDVPPRSLEEARKRRIFRHVSEARWRIFLDPRELADELAEAFSS